MPTPSNVGIYQEPAPPAISLSHNDWGQLVLVDAAGATHVGVTPVRAFPLSAPDHCVSLVDAAGHELATINDPELLSPESRRELEAALRSRNFVPVIQRIVYCSGILEPCEWEVDTDRGRTRFVLKNEDDVHRLGPQRALVIDAEGMRYLIPNARAMDAASRKVVERYL